MYVGVILSMAWIHKSGIVKIRARGREQRRYAEQKMGCQCPS